MDNQGFKAIDKSTISQIVVDQICNAIAAGRYKPGDKIPTEKELANSFECGRNSVREAIQIMVSHGILEIKRAEGTFVSSGINKAMVNPLVYGLILNNGNSKKEMIEFQIEIDKAVSRMSAKNRTEHDIEKLTIAYDRLIDALSKKPQDIQDIFEKDKYFHQIVVDSTHNRFMGIVYSAIWELLGEIINEEILAALNAEPELMHDMHTNIYNAIITKNEIAATEAIIPYVSEQNA